MAAVLSNLDILAARKEGSVVIEPFNPKHLGTNSYDVTLGRSFFAQSDQTGYMCPWNPEHARKQWGLPLEAKKIQASSDAELMGCQVGDEVIVIPPGDTILAHTNEYIGGRRNVTTKMYTRSSMGRSCLAMCKCAGLGDVGYINRWTYEIQNTGKMYAVLVVGQRIAQIMFERTGEVEGSYENKGSYQRASSEDLKAVMDQWKPEDMLPQPKRDLPTRDEGPDLKVMEWSIDAMRALETKETPPASLTLPRSTEAAALASREARVDALSDAYLASLTSPRSKGVALSKDGSPISREAWVDALSDAYLESLMLPRPQANPPPDESLSPVAAPAKDMLLSFGAIGAHIRGMTDLHRFVALAGSPSTRTPSSTPTGLLGVTGPTGLQGTVGRPGQVPPQWASTTASGSQVASSSTPSV